MDSAGVNEQPAYDFRRYRIEFLEPQAAFAVVYFRRMLSKASAAQEYLAGRALNAESIER